VVRASASTQTTHPRLRVENSGINRQTHTAGRANRANRYTSYRTGFPSRLCRTRSFTG